MKIVTCYKIVRDEQDIQQNADRTLAFDHAALKIGDYDLNPIEAGVQLASATGATVVSLTAGSSEVEDSKIRKSVLSRGPQENVAIKDTALASCGAFVTATVLAQAIRTIGDVEVVLCGEGSADLYAQQVGVQLGEMLGMPTVNGVSAITIEDGTAKLERTVGAEVEMLEVPLPVAIMVSSDINRPRIPTMKDILSAGKKPSKVLGMGDLGINLPADPLLTVSTLAPERKARQAEFFEGDDRETVTAFFARVSERL
ncbi:MAG: putative electron transfer flavoprotein FixA [Eggerthellaceae bacterium]|nr:putative electron transfer flavoprotein FixA [Eggerthellaceae bacterium]